MMSFCDGADSRFKRSSAVMMNVVPGSALSRCIAL